MVDMAFFRGGLGRWLPPSVPPVDEAVLLRQCWELLVLDRPGGAAAGRRRLAAGGGPPAGLKSKRSAHMGAPLAFSPVSPVGVSIRYPAFR